MTPMAAAGWLEAYGAELAKTATCDPRCMCGGVNGELRFVAEDLRWGDTGDVKRCLARWERQSRRIRHLDNTPAGHSHVRLHRQLTIFLRRLMRLVVVPHKGEVYRGEHGPPVVVDFHRGCTVWYRSWYDPAASLVRLGFSRRGTYGELPVPKFYAMLEQNGLLRRELLPGEAEQLPPARGLPDDN